ncbi:MAG: hypothetical protein R3250_16045, partial [Melioribacteraceae bacterium]|nr:hypothetical protein [Melioribacteraceae bacterium]
GNATGMDLYAQLNFDSFYAWLSYGLLYANEDLKDDNEGEYRRYTDQRHTISFVGSINISNNWRFSLKAYYGSGFPYTPKTAVQTEQGIWIWQAGNRNSATLPAYRRVDVRLSKVFEYTNFRISAFIDVSNVFNFENIQQLEYTTEPDVAKPAPDKILLWPILPSFGVRFEF